MAAQTKAVSKEMTIENILNMFPHKAQCLAYEITNAGLYCIGCQAAPWETLETGMKNHGMGTEAVERLVQRLNDLLEEEANPSTISLTKRAAKEYLEIVQSEGRKGCALRVEEIQSGCCRLEYALNYSETANSDDNVFESHGVQIHVHKEIAPNLMGSEIDYLEGPHGSGFRISNPNVNSSCQCSSSGK